MIQEFVFSLDSESSFKELMNNEMARSRRMQTSFCVASFSLEDIAEITRVFGAKGIAQAMAKMKFYLRTIFRATDRISQPNQSTFAVLLPQLDRDMLMKRLMHLDKQFNESYIEHKGTTIKFPLKVSVGVATFPQDGKEVGEMNRKIGPYQTCI